MKFRCLFSLMFICFNTASADFSNTQVWVHPLYIATGEPFIVDIRGEWPTDCHPGEQKPVISEYTGDTALIEFETIVEHVTCNDVVTPYRVLVDMSDVIGSVEGEFDTIDITIRFGDAEKERQVTTFCGLWCDPPPPPRDIKPEAGLYYSNGLEKQGLLLARQNQRMGVYPLIYDESGSSEWLFGAGEIVEDVYFTELHELTGGQCLGCLPPDEPTQMEDVGKLTMLMDSEGLIQVKVNDGLFTTYQQIEFGYGSRDIGGHPNRRVPDLTGRWAFAEDVPDSPYTIDSCPNPDTPYVPLVFDITLESVSVVIPPIVTVYPPMLPGYVMFSVRNKVGDEVAQMKCDYGSDFENVHDAEMVCNVNHPDINDGDTMYEVRQLSAERLSFYPVGPIIPEIPVVTRIAVRID
jgi:hypothetical protein